MYSILFGQRTTMEDQFRYYLLASDVESLGQNYGIRIDRGDGESAIIPNITLFQHEIEDLLNILLRNTVTPSTLRDVVEDWILR